MTRVIPLLAATIGLLAVTSAAQAQRGLNLSVPAPGSNLPLPPVPPADPPAGSAQPAPTPNRDADNPWHSKNSGNAPSLGPSLFSRSDTYRGEGFNKGSTAQSDQDKRTKPAAGFNLTVPFAPN